MFRSVAYVDGQCMYASIYRTHVDRSPAKRLVDRAVDRAVCEGSERLAWLAPAGVARGTTTVGAARGAAAAASIAGAAAPPEQARRAPAPRTTRPTARLRRPP